MALDARSAKQLWLLTYPTNQGFHIGSRAPFTRAPSFRTTPDAHLVALDARREGERNVEIAERNAASGRQARDHPPTICSSA